MSYILDALRKADAERRSAATPSMGLTEPPVLVDDDADDLPPARARPWAWVLGGMALTLAAAGAWTLFGRGETPPAPLLTAATPPESPPELPPEPAPPYNAPAPNADALPNFPPALPEAPKPEPAAPPVTAKRPLPPGIALVPAPPLPNANSNRIYSFNELPEEVRRDLPKLNVGGAMYGERSADRMVVFNGQVFHEGDSLGKGLTLKQIRLKSAVLEFRGYRLEIGY